MRIVRQNAQRAERLSAKKEVFVVVRLGPSGLWYATPTLGGEKVYARKHNDIYIRIFTAIKPLISLGIQKSMGY